MARVYTFKIVYIGCENKIWRDIQISSNSTMAVLRLLKSNTHNAQQHRYYFDAVFCFYYKVFG